MPNYSMHIFALEDGAKADTTIHAKQSPPVNVFSCYTGEFMGNDTQFVIPSLTTDGRISLIHAGNADALERLRGLVSAGFSQGMGQLSKKGVSDVSICNFVVVGISIAAPDVNKGFLVFRPLVSPQTMPELQLIYTSLKTYTQVSRDPDGETAKSKIQTFFSEETQKNWVNGIIAIWKKNLKWDQLVDAEIAQAGPTTQQRTWKSWFRKSGG